MWMVVDDLRKTGVTIILTTHYIEEAEAIADRVAVINQGEIIVIEDKKELIKKMGHKKLNIELQEKITEIPKDLAKYNLEIELISDPDIKLIKDLGSWVKKSMYGKEYMGVERSTFLIDQNNKIVEIWRKVKVSGHVEKVLNSCKNLIN